jgi:hypothetical protein
MPTFEDLFALNERIAIWHQSRVLPGEKHSRRHQPNASLSGAERSEGTGKLSWRRPLQLQVRRAMKERAPNWSRLARLRKSIRMIPRMRRQLGHESIMTAKRS